MANMTYLMLKFAITSLLIVTVSETGKRSALIGAIFASLPLISILGMLWLYIDTRDKEKIAALSQSVFWLVLPSLPMFLILPQLLKRGLNFPASLGISVIITVCLYSVMVFVLQRFDAAA